MKSLNTWLSCEWDGTPIEIYDGSKKIEIDNGPGAITDKVAATEYGERNVKDVYFDKRSRTLIVELYVPMVW